MHAMCYAALRNPREEDIPGEPYSTSSWCTSCAYMFTHDYPLCSTIHYPQKGPKRGPKRGPHGPVLFFTRARIYIGYYTKIGDTFLDPILDHFGPLLGPNIRPHYPDIRVRAIHHIMYTSYILYT